MDNRAKDFEAGLAALRTALGNNPKRQEQVRGWRMYRGHEPMKGNTLYVFVIDPAIAGQDYWFKPILEEGLPPADAARAFQQLSSSLAASMNRLQLRNIESAPGLTPPAPRIQPSPSVSTSATGKTISASFQFEGNITATVEARVMETNDVWWEYARGEPRW